MPKTGKILVVVSGLKGLMLSSFTLVKRLQKKGHTVLWASVTENTHWAKANNIDEIDFPNFFDSTNVDLSLKAKLGRFINRQLQTKKCFEQQIESLKINEISKVLKEHQFDLIIADIELHEVVLAAHQSKTKILLLSPWFSVHQDDLIPPILSNKTYNGTTNYQKEWQTVRKKNQEEEQRYNRKYKSISRKNALKQVANSIDFSEDHWIAHEWPQPFHYSQLPILTTTMKEVDFPRNDWKNVTHIGPLIDLNRHFPLQDQFHMARIIQAKSEGKQVILITLSSFEESEQDTLQAILTIAKRKSNWFFIIAPTAHKVESIENVFTSSWIPQLEVLKYVDLSINHGGINTIHECIYHEVPMLIYSGGKHDQNGCMTRCVYHGIAYEGRSLDQLTKDIEQVLSDSDIKNKLSALNPTFLSYQTEEYAEGIIQDYIDQ